MNKSRVIGVMVLVMLLFASFGYAQKRFQGGFNFTLGLPQSDFKNQIDNIGLGIGGHFLYNISKSPISVGVSLGYITYGSETRKEPFSMYIPGVIVDVTTKNNILLCHLLVRIQPQKGEFRPYFDGLFGFNYLWTKTGIYSQDSYYGPIASDVLLSDAALSYGAGGGLMIQVYEKDQNSKENPFALYIDVGARYLKGGEAEYLKEGSIIQENSYIIYDVTTSTTDILTVHMGITFIF